MKNQYQTKKIYSSLNIENIADVDYTLLLADTFEIFKDNCIKIYALDPAHFFSAAGLAW